MTAYVLNILDLLFTLHALHHGAVELNPLMLSVPFMVFYKIIVVGLLCWLLGYLGCRKGLKVCSAAFAMVNVWHVVNIF